MRRSCVCVCTLCVARCTIVEAMASHWWVATPSPAYFQEYLSPAWRALCPFGIVRLPVFAAACACPPPFPFSLSPSPPWRLEPSLPPCCQQPSASHLALSEPPMPAQQCYYHDGEHTQLMASVPPATPCASPPHTHTRARARAHAADDMQDFDSATSAGSIAIYRVRAEGKGKPSLSLRLIHEASCLKYECVVWELQRVAPIPC